MTECRHGREDCQICINPFYSEVYDIVFKKNRNVLILIEGQPGTGKSWLGCKIGNALDKGFNEDNLIDRVVFEPKNFLRILNEEKLYKGAVVMLEEFGIQADHRKWYSINNMVVNYIMQVFRYKNLIVIINVPVSDFIDSDTKKLFNFVIETRHIDFNASQCICRIKRLSYSSVTKKIYRQHLRYRVNGEWLAFKWWKIGKPQAKIVHAYDKLQIAYKSGLIDKMYRELSMMEKKTKEKETKKMLVETDAIKYVLENKEKFFSTNRKGTFDQQKIEFHFGVGRFVGNRIKKMAEQKLGEDANG